jgi:trans-2,3-dihydro-3-hydroxyanthranilate isomerase
MNLSESVFVRRSEVADFGVRYFTPAEEIPLAGHPTIATTYALIDTGRLALTGRETTLTLELKVGPIKVEVLADDAGRVQSIVMTQKKPTFLATYDPADIQAVFGLSSTDLLSDLPIQTVSTGTPQLMIPVTDLAALGRIKVNLAAFTALRTSGDFFSVHLFCLEGVTTAGETFARHFASPPDIFEDPFTGSATGGMGAYLWHYGLIDRPTFVAEQGHWLKRPGQATVEVIGPRDEIETVKVGGGAATILRGELTL